MSDLERLVDDGAEDSFLREMLASATDDVPDAGRRALTLAALSPEPVPLGSPAEPPKNAAATGPGAQVAASGGATLKWVVVIGLAVGALAIGLYSKGGGDTPPSPSSATPAITQAAPPAIGPAASVQKENGLPANVPAASASSLETAVASSLGPKVDTAPTASSPATITDRIAKPVARAPLGLAEETAILDRARSAIGRGDPRAALVELDRYDAAPAPKILGQEATLVRIEALSAKGDTAGARALAQSFLARNPGSTYDERVRALIAEPKKP